MKVLSAIKADIESLDHIQRECLDHGQWQDFKFLLESPNHIVYKAVVKDKTVGLISASSVQDESDIIVIAVLKEFRGQGIGSMLLEALIMELKNRNINKLFLDVNETNIPAIKLYKKFGFVEISKRKNYYGKNAAIVMKKEL